MKIVLGGYLETALIHYTDRVKQPDRNETTHPYYICLNRRVPKSYFDRAGTFVSLAQTTIVPSIDWNRSVAGERVNTDLLGLDVNNERNFGGQEWDDDSKKLSSYLIERKVFSAKSWVHLSDLDLKYRDIPKSLHGWGDEAKLAKEIAGHFLCRLFLQVRASQESEAMLVLAEPDIEVLAEIGTFAARNKLPLPFAFPDLRDHTIDADEFAGGLLNYAPVDVLSVIAVRQDKDVQKYAANVSEFLQGAEAFNAQSKIIGAMRDAYEMKTAAQKAEKAFEIASWIVKPLHYVPVVAEALTFAEDAKDFANLFLKRTENAKEWYMLAAKMTDLSVKDYLARKGNVG